MDRRVEAAAGHLDRGWGFSPNPPKGYIPEQSIAHVIRKPT
jgi:hypothetical protein